MGEIAERVSGRIKLVFVCVCCLPVFDDTSAMVIARRTGDMMDGGDNAARRICEMASVVEKASSFKDCANRIRPVLAAEAHVDTLCTFSAYCEFRWNEYSALGREYDSLFGDVIARLARLQTGESATVLISLLGTEEDARNDNMLIRDALTAIGTSAVDKLKAVEGTLKAFAEETVATIARGGERPSPALDVTDTLLGGLRTLIAQTRDPEVLGLIAAEARKQRDYFNRLFGNYWGAWLHSVSRLGELNTIESAEHLIDLFESQRFDGESALCIFEALVSCRERALDLLRERDRKDDERARNMIDLLTHPKGSALSK